MIFGLAIFTGGFFWQAASESYDSLLAARIIGGLGGGVVESMGPMIVVILFPPEYLDRAMSVYTWSLGAGTVFGPLFVGYLIEGLGSWRFPQYLFGIMSALNMVGSILMFPEPIMNIRVRGEPPLFSAPDPSCGDEAPISKRGRETISLENLGPERSVQDEQRESAAPPVPPGSWTNLWTMRSFFLRFTHHHPVSGWLSMAMAPYRMLAVPAVVLTVLLFGVLWSVVNVNMTSGCTILISYATDIYAAKAIDIGVVVNVLKNAIAAGISFAVVDWWTKDGWYMFLALALVKFLIFVLVASLWIWGPKIAHVTRSWRWLQGHNVN
ncbi:hypothetical protein KNSL1_012527 [Colletotrichum chrysophilum]|nr:hypothetical protein KNSL1_012527 [Colletotrichum chrysophilum]